MENQNRTINVTLIDDEVSDGDERFMGLLELTMTSEPPDIRLKNTTSIIIIDNGIP